MSVVIIVGSDGVTYGHLRLQNSVRGDCWKREIMKGNEGREELNSESESRHVGTLTRGRRLFSEAAHHIIPAGDIFLAISLRRHFTSHYRLPLSEHSHTRTHINARTHTHTRHPHIWPLVTGCLWAIVCGADDHCHRLIPLPVVLWWMWPPLASTDTGVLDHGGKCNEQRELRRREGEGGAWHLFFKSVQSVCHTVVTQHVH